MKEFKYIFSRDLIAHNFTINSIKCPSFPLIQHKWQKNKQTKKTYHLFSTYFVPSQRSYKLDIIPTEPEVK